jgi:OHCU decarboxylase
LNPGTEKLTLGSVNELSREEFVERFGPVFEDSPWVAEAAWERRPFEDFSALHEALERAMWEAPRERQLALIRAHPDLAGKAAVAGELTPESASEQASAGLDRLSPEEFEAFTAMNREYRERFGMPMIVCVREHTRESILRSARRRLGNSTEEEVQAALGEISKIARLRLEELVEGGRR